MTFETRNPVVRGLRAFVKGAWWLIFETELPWAICFVWQFVQSGETKEQIALAGALVVILTTLRARQELDKLREDIRDEFREVKRRLR